jgi:hypothetical protein
MSSSNDARSPKPATPADASSLHLSLRSVGIGSIDEDNADALIEIYSDAVSTGIMLAADGQDARALRDWAKGSIPAAALACPDYFAPDAPHRSLAIACLRFSLDVGFEARIAFEAKRRGDVPSPHAPDGFIKATLPPFHAWIRRQAERQVAHLAIACSVDGLEDVSVEDILAATGTTPEVAFDNIDDEGVHRIHSSYLRQDGTGTLYQLIVTRCGRDVSVSRRVCGDPKTRLVRDNFTLVELEFVAQAFQQVTGEFRPPTCLTAPSA